MMAADDPAGNPAGGYSPPGTSRAKTLSPAREESRRHRYIPTRCESVQLPLGRLYGFFDAETPACPPHTLLIYLDSKLVIF